MQMRKAIRVARFVPINGYYYDRRLHERLLDCLFPILNMYWYGPREITRPKINKWVILSSIRVETKISMSLDMTFVRSFVLKL